MMKKRTIGILVCWTKKLVIVMEPCCPHSLCSLRADCFQKLELAGTDACSFAHGKTAMVLPAYTEQKTSDAPHVVVCFLGIWNG